jgi:hypothetical protein
MRAQAKQKSKHKRFESFPADCERRQNAVVVVVGAANGKI